MIEAFREDVVTTPLVQSQAALAVIAVDVDAPSTLKNTRKANERQFESAFHG